jgi:hypothetical protein
MPALMRVAGGG